MISLWLFLGLSAYADNVDAELMKDLDFFVAMDALEVIDPEFPSEEAKEGK